MFISDETRDERRRRYGPLLLFEPHKDSTVAPLSAIVYIDIMNETIKTADAEGENTENAALIKTVNEMSEADFADHGGDNNNTVAELNYRPMALHLERTIRRAHPMGLKIVAGTDGAYGPKSATRVSQEIMAFVNHANRLLQDSDSTLLQMRALEQLASIAR